MPDKSLTVLTGDRTVPMSQALTKKFGRCSALLIQQVHYWCTVKPNRKLGQAWCYNTQDEWARQIGYSKISVRRAVKELTEAGVLVLACLNSKGFDRTLWYRIDYDVMSTSMCSKWTLPCAHFEHMDEIKMSTPIPKSISESNSKTPSVVNDALVKPVELSKEDDVSSVAEILKLKETENAKKHRLPIVWLKKIAEAKGFQKPMGVKECSQLKTYQRQVGDRSEEIMLWAMENWWSFAAECKASAGLETVPAEPVVGFLLKHCDVAVNMYTKKLAQPSLTNLTLGEKPVTIVEVGQTQNLSEASKGEEVHKATPEEIAALLAEL